MTEPTPCEFFLLRYVPDVIKGEFINIGILIRKSGESRLSSVRFTRDWSRVQAVNPDADVALFKALEIDIAERLRAEPVDTILGEFLNALSNSFQIDGPHACLALTLEAELDRLMLLYVESNRES